MYPLELNGCEYDDSPNEPLYECKLSTLAETLILYVQAVCEVHAAQSALDDALDAQFDTFNNYIIATEALASQEAE